MSIYHIVAISLKAVLVVANSADPHEMQHYPAFHLSLYSLPKSPCRGFQETKGKYGQRREKTCLRGFANNKGVDQPAHPRSLISAFVICFLKSIRS